MDPGQLEALLGLDAARVAAVAGATEDYAKLLRATELEPLGLDATAGGDDEAQDALSIAGGVATAASLWMLVEPHRAAPLFDAAPSCASAPPPALRPSTRRSTTARAGCGLPRRPF